MERVRHDNVIADGLYVEWHIARRQLIVIETLFAEIPG